jgi:hypothetical protein
MQRNRGLDVDQDLDFQRKDWTFERIGWIAMLLFVIAAALGVFGRGPLSKARASAPDGSMSVEYSRFERHGAPSHFTVTLRPAAAMDSTVSLWVSDAYLDGVWLERIVPQPVKEISQGDRTVFEVPVFRDSARVSFHFRPDRLWSQRIELGSPGRDAMRLSRFVYP